MDLKSNDIRVIIKGAGGHGVVVADILWRMHRGHAGIIPVGFIDDNPALAGACSLELDVIGADLSDKAGKCDALIVAIGDNRTRMRNFLQFKKQGVEFVSAIHPSAVIADSAEIGPGTMICAGAVINPLAKIGDNVILNTACTIDHHNIIGDHVHIAPGAHLGGNVQIGEGVLVGIGATILPGRKIGSWSIIAGGAVVTRDVPDGIVYNRHSSQKMP